MISSLCSCFCFLVSYSQYSHYWWIIRKIFCLLHLHEWEGKTDELCKYPITFTIEVGCLVLRALS